MINPLVWTEKSLPRNRLTGIYEPLQPFILHEAAERLSAQVMIDVGANIGFYTVLLGKIDSVDEVHAFEPMPEPFRELRDNVQLNHLTDKCFLHQVALSDTPGQGEMAVIGECSGANALSVTSIHHDKQAAGSVLVPLNTVDELIDAARKPFVMKLDVEGHEFSVLKGASRLLGGHGVLQVEIYDQNRLGREIAALLNEKGWYRFFAAGPDQYFTNSPEMRKAEKVIELLEAATAKMIHYRLNPGSQKGPIRRKIAPGVVAELSPRLSRVLRTALRRA